MSALPPANLVTGSFAIWSPDDQTRVRLLADSLLSSTPRTEDLINHAREPDVSIDVALALKMAVSKAEVQSLGWTGNVAVMFAMWGEQRRLRPRSADNPTGEDALATKLDQLDWLLDGTEVNWSVVAVDDGDPDDSAEVARQRAQQHRFGDRVTVLRLGDALPDPKGPLAHLDDVDQSRKGGAMVLGAQHAMESGADAIVLTDADNSVNLGQLGLLLGPFVRDDVGAVIGDRKHPDSVLVKADDRWGPGIVVLRHMQRMVGRALFDRGLRDTQAAFKLYGRRAVGAILEAPSTYGFSFDADWLMATASAGEEIDRVPFAFIDSFEESASIAQGPMTTWESLLTGLVAAARNRGVDHNSEMAEVIDDFVTAELLDKVITRVPQALVDAADADIGSPSLMSPAELRQWLEALG